MPPGIPSLAASFHIPADICVKEGSQGIIKVSPVDFIRPKYTEIWMHVGKALLLGISHASKKYLPHPSAAQLSLSKILLGSQAQLGEYDTSWEGGASGSPMTRRCLSGLWEGWRNGPFPKATQFSLS